MTLSANLVDGPEGLVALEPAWRDLFGRAAAVTPFQSPDWLIPWWRHFHPGDLATIAIRDGGRLVGLAPLYREDGPQGRRLLPIGISVSDYLAPLLDAGDPAAVGAALSGAVAALAPDWDAWSLEDLAPEAAALAPPAPPGCDLGEEVHQACPWLAIDGPADGDNIPLSVPVRQRRVRRRALRLADKRGGWRVERVGESVDGFLDDLFRLHTARWEDRGESGVVADPRVRAFQREAIPRLTAAGIARCWRLTIGDQLAGCYLGFRDERTVYAYLTGFDPAFAYESPGVILLGEVIRSARATGASRLDMLRGREAYKYAWGAADRWTVRRTYRRRAAA